MEFSYLREHADEDLEAEILLVSRALCFALDDPDIRVSENALEHRLRHMAGKPKRTLKSPDWSHSNCILYLLRLLKAVFPLIVSRSHAHDYPLSPTQLGEEPISL